MQINNYRKTLRLFFRLVAVKLGDLQDAIESFERAHEMATVQGDEPAQRAIAKALEELNRKIVQGIREGDSKRAEEEAGEKQEEKEEAKEEEKEAQKVDEVQGENEASECQHNPVL